jgi:hypothetical protein
MDSTLWHLSEGSAEYDSPEPAPFESPSLERVKIGFANSRRQRMLAPGAVTVGEPAGASGSEGLTRIGMRDRYASTPIAR